MIDVHGLTKRYGEKVAVEDLSLTVRPGVITGFLGPNGAGKSTTMRLILGLDHPSAGSATVNGRPYAQLRAPLREVGAMLESRAIHTGRSGRNHLLALAQTHGIPVSRIDEVIDIVGLSDVAGKRVGSFSLGMGQRLGIAAALRSTRWSLLAALVAMAGLGPLVAAFSMARWSHLSPHDRLHFDAIDRSLAGYHLAQLAIGVLGVLVISGEYSTGMIRSSLMAVPRRLPVLWAKLSVFALVGFVLMLVASVIGFFASQAILTHHHVNVTLSHPHALRTLLGTVLYMTMTGVLCTALGTILRSTAGGISTFAALLFVLPGITDILPSSLGNAIHPWLPSSAGGGISQAVQDAHMLSPWGGFAVFVGYTALAVIAAAYLLVHRDA